MWTTLYTGAAKQTAQSFYHNNNNSPTDFFNIRQEIANVVSLHNVHQPGRLDGIQFGCLLHLKCLKRTITYNNELKCDQIFLL